MGLSAVVVLALVAPLMAVPALAGAPAISLKPTSGKPGDHVTVHGNGFGFGVNVSIIWAGTDEIAKGTTEDDGTLDVPFVVPTAKAGVYDVTACASKTSDCDAGKAAAQFTVNQKATPPPTRTPKPTAKPTSTPTKTARPTPTTPTARPTTAPTEPPIVIPPRDR